MKNRFEKSFNKLIIRYILEIVIAVLFVVISYFSFTINNLSTAQSVAVFYENSDRDIQVVLGTTHKDEQDILNQKNIIDKKELIIKNTNKKEVYVDVILKVKKDDNDIAKINMSFMNEKINFDNAILKDGYYELQVYSTKMNKYERLELPVVTYGNPLKPIEIDYIFEINESFYL